MSEPELVVCGEHGESPSTFACRHVATGVACGFHCSADDPDDRWPDAWCDLCEEAFQAAGGWNEVSEKQADIQLLCCHCYEAARSRNQSVPLRVRGISARLTNEEASELIHHAVHQGQAANDASDRRWGWRNKTRWDFDAGASTLTFQAPGSPTVIADVRLVGSYSTNSGTFQWAWQTFGENAPQAAAISKLRTFGEVRGISRLTTPNWSCEEIEGWEMTSLAALILGAEGLYRAPFDHLFWFMLLSRWRTVI